MRFSPRAASGNVQEGSHNPDPGAFSAKLQRALSVHMLISPPSPPNAQNASHATRPCYSSTPCSHPPPAACSPVCQRITPPQACIRSLKTLWVHAHIVISTNSAQKASTSHNANPAQTLFVHPAANATRGSEPQSTARSHQILSVGRARCHFYPPAPSGRANCRAGGYVQTENHLFRAPSHADIRLSPHSHRGQQQRP
jgi:hypothetical protein